MRRLAWLVLIAGVAVGVHLAIQSIVRGGEAGNRQAGPDLSRLMQIERDNPQVAARMRAGMARYEATCRLCHHRAGIGGRFTPPIAGRPEEWVAAMLTLYRSGARVGPLTNLMAPWAADLTDEDIKNLAAYVSTL